MSFLSALIFYRPTPPPAVTLAALGEFLKRLNATGIYRPTPNRFHSVQANFGRRIDQDGAEKIGIQVYRRGGIACVRTFDERWDFSKKSRAPREQVSHSELAQALRTYRHGFVRRLLRTPDTLCRAQCHLGIVANSIWQSVVVVPENSGSYPMRLDNWSLDIGPVLLYPDPTQEQAQEIDALQVGWIDLRLSGQGSRGAQTPAQIVARAEAQPSIHAMMQLCRDFWPVEPAPVSEEVIASRRLLGPFWPYAEYDRPWDWYWGFRES